MAALTPDDVVSPLNLSGIDLSFTNATLYTWTLGLEEKFKNADCRCELCGDSS